MPVHEIEAIVLRQYSLSESDRIIVFISREYGKIRAAAKGVKRPKSRIAGCLEPLNHIQLEFYTREGHELSQVRQAELIHSYLGMNPSLKQICAFNYFAEISSEIAQDNQANAPLFRLLLAALKLGEKHGVNQALIRYFEVWCLKLSGLFPNYGYCSNCGKCVKDEGFFAQLQTGQGWCNACARKRGVKIGISASTALATMTKYSPEQFLTYPLSEDAAHEIEQLAGKLLELHLEKQLKSYRILTKALRSF
jgi:DNA repair protein RecO (recombination protein O)